MWTFLYISTTRLLSGALVTEWGKWYVGKRLCGVRPRNLEQIAVIDCCLYKHCLLRSWYNTHPTKQLLAEAHRLEAPDLRLHRRLHDQRFLFVDYSCTSGCVGVESKVCALSGQGSCPGRIHGTPDGLSPSCHFLPCLGDCSVQQCLYHTPRKYYLP